MVRWGSRTAHRYCWSWFSSPSLTFQSAGSHTEFVMNNRSANQCPTRCNQCSTCFSNYNASLGQANLGLLSRFPKSAPSANLEHMMPCLARKELSLKAVVATQLVTHGRSWSICIVSRTKCAMWTETVPCHRGHKALGADDARETRHALPVSGLFWSVGKPAMVFVLNNSSPSEGEENVLENKLGNETKIAAIRALLAARRAREITTPDAYVIVSCASPFCNSFCVQFCLEL